MTKNDDNNNSDLTSDFQKQIKNRLFLWILRQNLFVKIILGLLTILIVSAMAWLGYFGNKPQTLIESIIPTCDTTTKIVEPDWDSLLDAIEERKEIDKKNKDSIPSKNIIIEGDSSKIDDSAPEEITIIEKKKPRIMSQLTFTINGKDGKNEGSYKQGDEIKLFLSLNQSCYVLFMNIDSKGIYFLEDESFELFNKINKQLIGTYYLDDTEGIEVYYAFVSHKNINPEVIKNKVENMQALIDGLTFKGAKKSPFFFKPPNGVYQDHIYFYSNYSENK